MPEITSPASASPVPQASKPPSYSVDAKLPSVEVTKEFLQDLERYILAKAQEHSPRDAGEIRSDYSVELQDSLGKNVFPSISDFEAANYPNDTKQVELAYRSWRDSRFSLSISLSLDGARIRCSVCRVGAREALQGIHAEVLRMFNQYKNHNWIYHIPSLTGAVWGALTVTWGILFTRAWIYELPLATLAVAFLVSTRWRPFCVFPTRQNASHQYWHRWFIGAILAFFLFTVAGVYFRKQLLGF
jgi:hypothetical protein